MGFVGPPRRIAPASSFADAQNPSAPVVSGPRQSFGIKLSAQTPEKRCGCAVRRSAKADTSGPPASKSHRSPLNRAAFCFLCGAFGFMHRFEAPDAKPSPELSSATCGFAPGFSASPPSKGSSSRKIYAQIKKRRSKRSKTHQRAARKMEEHAQRGICGENASARKRKRGRRAAGQHVHAHRPGASARKQAHHRRRVRSARRGRAESAPLQDFSTCRRKRRRRAAGRHAHEHRPRAPSHRKALRHRCLRFAQRGVPEARPCEVFSTCWLFFVPPVVRNVSEKP